LHFDFVSQPKPVLISRPIKVEDWVDLFTGRD